MASGKQPVDYIGLQDMKNAAKNYSRSDSENDETNPHRTLPEAEPMLDKSTDSQSSPAKKPRPAPRVPSNPNLLEKQKPVAKPRMQSKSSVLDEKPPLEGPSVNEPFINPNDSQFDPMHPTDLSSDDKETITGAFLSPQLPEELKVGEIEKQPAPTGLLAWVGLGCSLFALACCCVSFASPYWMQAYPMSFNSFSNMGLWEICMRDYMHHKDDTQTVYDGCWWVFNDDQRYSKLTEWLLPPWFITCQVMVVMDLFCHLAVIGIIIMIYLHFCPLVNHEYHQCYAMFAASGLCFFITMLTAITGMMYGVFCGDRQWMPRPDLNFISWGYGFFIIQGIVATGAGVCYFLEAQKAYNELDRRDQEYTRAVMDMELSQAYPMDGQSYGAPSYTGSDRQPDYPAAEQKSYTSQPSYDPFPRSVSQVGYDPGPYSQPGQPAYGDRHQPPSYPGYT